MKNFLRDVGLDSEAGLIPAGIYREAGLQPLGGFNPTHLNPYLLFDTRTSMLGELESPTLDLDPAVPSSLDVITATRSGVATYTDADGLIQTADPNTVRIDHVDGVPMMLIEPSATNLLEYSEDFSNSYWSKNDVTVSAAPVAAPDGTMTASHVVATGPNAHLIKLNVVTANSDTVSIWARTASGSGTVFFKYHSGDPVTVTDEWQRFEVTAKTNHVYAVDFRGSATLDEIYIWGAQAETGSVATSYIPTNGSAVTRNADNLVIDGAAFSDFYNPTEGTFYLEAIERTQENRAGFITGQGASQFFLYHNGSNTLWSFDGDYWSSLVNRPVNELFRAAATYTPTTKTISMNGAVSTVDVHNGNWAAANILNVGWGGSNTFHQLNGHIKRLIYWPTHSDNL